MARAIVTTFDPGGMTIDRDSLSNLVIAQTKNMYTGIMWLRKKRIYFAALSKPEHDKDDHYGTMTPKHLDKFPCRVCERVIVPITHNRPATASGGDKDKVITSHDQLAAFVVARLGGAATAEDFCGFALRFEDGKRAALAPTSRTLNPGYNGQLEPVLFDAVSAYLGPKLALLGYTLAKVTARTDPDQAHLQRMQRAGIAGAAVLPKGLLGALNRIGK